MRAKKAAEALANAALAQGSSANAKRGLKVCTQYDAISSCCLCCQGSQCTVAFAACFVNLKCFLLSLRLSPCCQAKRKVTPWDTHEGQAMRIRAVMDKFYCAPELASMGVERRAMVLGLAEDIQVGGYAFERTWERDTKQASRERLRRLHVFAKLSISRILEPERSSKMLLL